MTYWWRALGASIVIALVAGGSLLLAPGFRREIWAASALAVATVFLTHVIALIAAGKMGERSAYEEALAVPTRPVERPADLQALERAFGWRIYSGAEYDHRLRPVLKRAARSRLGVSNPPPAIADLLSDRPTSDSVRTAQIAGTVSEIEGLK